MRIKVREQIKSLAAARGMTLTVLAEKMAGKTDKNYTIDTLSARLRRGSLTYNEVLAICEILDYEITFNDKSAK